MTTDEVWEPDTMLSVGVRHLTKIGSYGNWMRVIQSLSAKEEYLTCLIF